MNKKDLARVIAMLPRYDEQRPGSKRRCEADWKATGKLLIVNLPVLSAVIGKLIEKIIRRLDDAVSDGKWIPFVDWVDVSGDNIWVLHRALEWRHLKWLCSRNFAWQKWRYGRLPIYVRFHGKLIVWNGTHRMTLGRLAGKKIRAAVLDLDAFLRWSKKEKARGTKAKNKRPRA